MYLLDLKLAPRSHRWDPVSPLHSDSPHKSCFICWTNNSHSVPKVCQLLGTRERLQLEGACRWCGREVMRNIEKERKVGGLDGTGLISQ